MFIYNVRMFLEEHTTKSERETTISEWVLIVGICISFAFLASLGGLS